MRRAIAEHAADFSQAFTNDTSVVEHKVFITGTVASDDADYNGINFTFSIWVTPLNATARTVEIVIPPLTFPNETEVTVEPIPPDELMCSSFSATRFKPFGFNELSASSLAEAEQFFPPVRIYWRIPGRFRSLKQIKFVHATAKGMVDILMRLRFHQQ